MFALPACLTPLAGVATDDGHGPVYDLSRRIVITVNRYIHTYTTRPYTDESRPA